MMKKKERKKWFCLHFLHSNGECMCSCSWIQDGASTPAFPAERLVVGDAVHPVGEHGGADGGHERAAQIEQHEQSGE